MLKPSVSESGMQPNYPHLLNDRRMPNNEHNYLGDRNIFQPQIKARVMVNYKEAVSLGPSQESERVNPNKEKLESITYTGRGRGFQGCLDRDAIN